MFQACRSPLRSFLVALGVGWVVSIPTDVWAACGDYVHIGRHVRDRDASGHMSDSLHADSGSTDEIPFPAPACRGPACSRDSSPPPLSIPKIAVASDEWACASVGSDLVMTSAGRVQPRAFTSPENGSPQDILRPPR